MQAGSTLARRQVDRRVLASSIDLDVELNLVALVQAGKAGTLNGADVHECIGLAVITRDEAEALHRVEELDGAGSLFAGELALRRRFTLGDGNYVANDRKLAGRDLAATVDELEFQLLTFGETLETRTLNRADVDEDVIAALITLDEAETLGCVEELYDATALANDLGRHTAASAAAETTTAAAATRAAAEATAARTAAEATTTAAAAEAAATEATATLTAAEAAFAAATETVAAAETILSGEERVELVSSANPITLVAPLSATTSIKTHVYELTFAAPHKHSPDAWTIRTERQGRQTKTAQPSPATTDLTPVLIQ